MANPLLSIILVVYREQAYLRDCVSSVLDQSFRDFEFVAVDNSSPDQGPGILDELAEQDDRLVVHHLDDVVRLGEALNLALDSAKGDYVWFVATTDQLPAGALAAVAARLDETAPDVLVVDQTRAVPPGRSTLAISATAFSSSVYGITTLQTTPSILAVRNGRCSAWARHTDRPARRPFRASPGSISSPTLRHPRAPMRRICSPVPKPMSSTLEPAGKSANTNSWSM